jgi:uncharacterized membrane protein YfhO
MDMTWVGIALLLVVLYFALKVVRFVLKLGLWSLLLFGAYWLVAPYLSLPLPF